MDLLKGVGHFSFWFVMGYFIFKILTFVMKNHFWLKLYGPFIPFVLAITAAFPYLLEILGILPHGQIMGGFYNIFLFYGVLNDFELVSLIFSKFHFAVFLDAVVYLLLLLHYIKLVKLTRRQHAK